MTKEVREDVGNVMLTSMRIPSPFVEARTLEEMMFRMMMLLCLRRYRPTPSKACRLSATSHGLRGEGGGRRMIDNVLAPGRPTMVLLLPTRTFVSPEIVPDTTTILGVESFSFTAAVNCARVETVVTVPPDPPLVLHDFYVSSGSNRLVQTMFLPSILRGKTKRGSIGDCSTLLDLRGSGRLVDSRRGRRSHQGDERGKDCGDLHDEEE